MVQHITHWVVGWTAVDVVRAADGVGLGAATPAWRANCRAASCTTRAVSANGDSSLVGAHRG